MFISKSGGLQIWKVFYHLKILGWTIYHVRTEMRKSFDKYGYFMLWLFYA